MSHIKMVPAKDVTVGMEFSTDGYVVYATFWNEDGTIDIRCKKGEQHYKDATFAPDKELPIWVED